MPTIDYKKQAQDYYSRAPAIILGSGASAAYQIAGMWELGQSLVNNVSTDGLDENELREWAHFCDLMYGGTDLETAMNETRISETLTERIVLHTWNVIAPRDRELFQQSIHEPHLFVLGELLQSMLRSAQASVDIITTNYDCLAEYACDQIALHHFSGFSHGMRRAFVPPGKVRAAKQANIWKVHGSLDWFKDASGRPVGIHNMDEVPEGLKPLIVTPGTEKYRLTHLEPFRTVMSHADAVIKSRSCYFCVGFGFNDQHLQPLIVERCLQDRIPIIVITRDLTEATKKFLFESGIADYLAIERASNDNESYVYSSLSEERLTVKEDVWSLKGFLSIIL
ncbi:SIR2 family protein [Marinobacter salarius]|uniref:SIR2 family protein n=1 Tax=Marinobacter salarius TaxID=1420917 RepID=UPI003BAC7D66